MSKLLTQPTKSVWIDQFSRQKRKLRISVTDRCNFKCVYCMPEHPKWMKKNDLLSFEALYQFCAFMVCRGIEQIKITGGEPLMRQGVVHFIKRLQQLKKTGLKRISMTTNGHYLKHCVYALKQAGLDDLNISLDSLDHQQFEQLTARNLDPVLDGIYAAKQAGFRIKINSVLIKDINDNQIIPLVDWARRNQFQLRFIEFMPLDGDQKWSNHSVVTEQDILNTISSKYDIKSGAEQGANPARLYLIDEYVIGIISTISNSFCGECDRLRLNAQGEFFNCLFAIQGLQLKTPIEQLEFNQIESERILEVQLRDYIWGKASGYREIQMNTKKMDTHPRKISMHMIGG